MGASSFSIVATVEILKRPFQRVYVDNIFANRDLDYAKRDRAFPPTYTSGVGECWAALL